MAQNDGTPHFLQKWKAKKLRQPTFVIIWCMHFGDQTFDFKVFRYKSGQVLHFELRSVVIDVTYYDDYISRTFPQKFIQILDMWNKSIFWLTFTVQHPGNFYLTWNRKKLFYLNLFPAYFGKSVLFSQWMVEILFSQI